MSYSDCPPFLPLDVWEQYLFHYISEGGLTFLVMADDSVGRRMPFAFLAELQRRVRRYDSPSFSSHLLHGISLPLVRGRLLSRPHL